MFYQTIDDDNNTREMISEWKGYDHNYVIDDGEFYDMENLSSDNYPVMTPRKKRALLVETEETIRGILLTDNNLTYLVGNYLHYGSKSYDLSEYFKIVEEQEDGTEKVTYDTSNQKLIRFNAYIIAFPSGVWVNTINDETGSITQAYNAPLGISITFTICDMYGSELQNLVATSDAPSDPSDGDYWLRTTSGAEGLYIYVGYLQTWEAVATCYIKISVPDGNLTQYFAAGDAVYMNTSISEINSGSIIQSIDDNYMIIIGMMDKVQHTEDTDAGWTLEVKRKLPDLDLVCVSNNRIWGCYYGDDGEGGKTNEIYASKLGDFKNWYCFAGLSTDSYTLSVGEPGDWTGCISYQGYPTFFKENCVMKIYGTYPAEYQLSTHTCRGVQKGSEESLAIVNEYLMYKSTADICVYDGSSPTSVSQALGRGTQYYGAVAAGCLGKYYVSMETNIGHTLNFIYDMEHGLWLKNDSKVRYSEFTQSESGQIYGTNGKKIFGIGVNDNIAFHTQLPNEEYVKWYGETGDMGFSYPDFKYVNNINIRAYLPYQSELNIQIKIDDGEWGDLGTYRGDGKTTLFDVYRFPERCDHYKLKLSGHGDVRIYSLTRTFETSSGESNGYAH